MYSQKLSVTEWTSFPLKISNKKFLKHQGEENKNSLIFSVFPLKCSINVNGKIIDFDVFLNLNIFGPICPIWEV